MGGQWLEFDQLFLIPLLKSRVKVHKNYNCHPILSHVCILLFKGAHTGVIRSWRPSMVLPFFFFLIRTCFWIPCLWIRLILLPSLPRWTDKHWLDDSGSSLASCSLVFLPMLNIFHLVRQGLLFVWQRYSFDRSPWFYMRQRQSPLKQPLLTRIQDWMVFLPSFFFGSCT